VSFLDGPQAFMDKVQQPKPEKPPIIPAKWRIPFFIGLVAASLALLALFVNFVVVPAVHMQAQSPASVPASAPKP
jgi:hypothetical protein